MESIFGQVELNELGAKIIIADFLYSNHSKKVLILQMPNQPGYRSS